MAARRRALALASTVGAATLDVPLTVEEPAGVARQAEPLTFGVPLPRGLIRDVARLRLVDPDGRAVRRVPRRESLAGRRLGAMGAR